MKLLNRSGLVLLVIASLILAACSPAKPATGKVKPAEIVKVEGSKFSKVVLTQKAAERLDIQTDAVHEEIVERAITVAGEVMDPQTVATKTTVPPGKALVKVFVSESDIGDVDQEEEAQVNSLDDENGDGFAAEMADDIDNGDQEDSDGTAFYYLADNSQNQLAVGQRVLVDITLKGSGVLQKVISYKSVIYGVKGETWVYTNPEPLVYIREPIVIDFIDEDMVVLKEGPTPGTNIVTIGVAELFGAETGVSK